MNRLICLLAPGVVAALLVSCGAGERAQRHFEAAESARLSGNYEVAEIGYRNVLRRDPQHVGSLRGMGMVLLDRGVTVEAARLLALARDRSPRDPVVLSNLGRALAELGYMEDARQQALAALELAPIERDSLVLVAETAMTPDEVTESAELLEGFSEVDPAGVDLALSLLALRQGELVVARARVNHALAREPDGAAGHALLAVLHSQAGDSSEALSSSKLAAELADVRSDFRLRYAMLLAASGRFGEAAEVLEDVTSGAPDFVTAWRVRGQLALMMGDAEVGVDLLDEGLKRNPVDLIGGVLRAEASVSEGDVDGALRLMNRLKEVHPPNPAIEFVVARAYLRQGEEAAAREALDRVLQLDAAHVGASLLKARMQLTDGDAKLAILAMEDLVARRPDVSEAQLLLAEAYAAGGRRSEASAILERRAAVAGDDFLPHLQLGLALRNEGRLADARLALEKAAELNADEEVVLSLLVGLDLSESRLADAQERVERFLVERPESAMAHFLRGVVLVRDDKTKDAESALETAISHDAGLLQAYSWLIKLHRQSGELEKVVDELSRLLEQVPADLSALMLRGALLHELGRVSEAARSYQRLLEIDPGFGPALNNLANIKGAEEDQLDHAYALARRAFAVLPNEPAVADTLGWILFRQGQYARALSLLRQAASGMPDDGQVQYHHGLAAYMMDEREVAKEAFGRAIGVGVEAGLSDGLARRLRILADDVTIDELRAGIADDGSDVIALVKVGEELEASGDFRSAREHFELALRVNPELLGARMNLAALYSGPLADPGKALEMAKAARELAPNNPVAAALIGRIAHAAGDHEWGYGLLRESVSRGGSVPGLKVDTAMAAYSLGRVGEARELMTEALEAGETDEDVALAGRFLLWTGEVDQLGVEDVEAADHGYVPVLMVKARRLELVGLLSEAGTTYRSILGEYPHFTPAKVGLARVLVNGGQDVDEARDLLVQAREASAVDREVMVLLARISLLQEDHAYGAQLMRQVVGAGMEAMDWYVLGRCLSGLGEVEGSIEALEKALAAGLGEPEASKARAIIVDAGTK